MEVHVSNLDQKLTKEKLQTSLTPKLHALNIKTYEIYKTNRKPFASITLPATSEGQRLLAATASDPHFFVSPSGRSAFFRPSHNPPDGLALRALRKDQKDQNGLKAWQGSAKQAAEAKPLSTKQKNIIRALRCGRWETSVQSRNPAFVPYSHQATEGTVKKNDRGLQIEVCLVQTKFIVFVSITPQSHLWPSPRSKALELSSSPCGCRPRSSAGTCIALFRIWKMTMMLAKIQNIDVARRYRISQPSHLGAVIPSC